MDITVWLTEKFITPLCRYYTPEATAAYGLALVAAVAGTYRLLQRLRIAIDRNFFLGLLPFIIYGGWARALRDHGLGIYQGWWWCSPPIYFIIFGAALGSLLAGLLVQRYTKFSYHKLMFTVGAVLLIYNATLTVITNWAAVAVIAGLMAIWSALFFGIHRLKPRLLSLPNAGIIVAHLLDGSASFTAIQLFGYYEQHVLPGFLIGLAGPWVMFPLKIGVVLAVLLAIDKWSDDKFFNNLLKIVILILGLALGVRDFLTVSMLTV